MTDAAAPVPDLSGIPASIPATDPLAPYDAVLLLSYGGPRRPEDVLPFMRNATAGRGVPDSRLLEVSGHYQGFGGASPINVRNAELRDALQARLAERGGQPSQTVVNMLQAQLLGIEELPAEYMASVEFSGLITEDGNGPSPFREAWNMTKPKTGPGGWLVAGIQPLS